MKTTILVFMAIVAVSVITHAQEKPASTEVDGKIDWVFDLEQGQQIARQTNRPMFIVFRCER